MDKYIVIPNDVFAKMLENDADLRQRIVDGWAKVFENAKKNAQEGTKNG